MFVLVTQADGSARRFTWITYAIAACFVAFFMQQNAANEIADGGRDEALAYLHENPYVVVDDQFQSVIPLDYAQALRETFFQERRELGLALMSEHLMARGQREFEQLLRSALVSVEVLPAWKLGIRSSDAPRANWFMHSAVHETQFALILSVVLLLCFGLALEDGWGSILFGCLASAGVVLTGFVSTSVNYFDATGTPWFGASGLLATLAGAYFVRSLRGSPRAFGMIPMPGWLLLPIWLAAEYLIVRGVSSSDEFVDATAIVQASGFGLGLVVSTAMMLLQVESKMLDRAQKTKELVSNPVLERAMAAKASGQAEEAFDLLRSEFRRSPKNRDVALALWDVSIEIGKASLAVDSILSVIERDLQTDQKSQAVAKWFAMTDEVAVLTARPQLFVRIGEALLDEGHPKAAVEALTRSMEGDKPLSTALAQRVVRIARDLDPVLARRAAEAALQDSRLGPTPEPVAAVDPATTDVDTNTDTNTDTNSDTSVELDDPSERQNAIPAFDEDISALDPGALSLDDLNNSDEAAEVPAEPEPPGLFDDPGPDLDTGDAGDTGDTNDELEGGFDELDDEGLTEVAMEPVVASEMVTQIGFESSIPEAHDTKSEATAPMSIKSSIASNSVTTTAVNIAPARRKLRVRNAVPVSLESKSLVIEVDGGNKTRLPFTRIDALAAAAIQGLGAKPVVVIDLVVNWQSASEPLKIIRLRSDRFDPAQLAPGTANQLEALRKLITDLLRLGTRGLSSGRTRWCRGRRRLAPIGHSI